MKSALAMFLLLAVTGCAGFNSPTTITKCSYCGWLVTPLGSEDGVVYYQCLAWTCGMITAATNSPAR